MGDVSQKIPEQCAIVICPGLEEIIIFGGKFDFLNLNWIFLKFKSDKDSY